MDHGKIVAEGTPTELKRQVASDTIRITLGEAADVSAIVRRALEDQAEAKSITQDGECLRVSVKSGEDALPLIMRALDREDVRISRISLEPATLDDVFLEKTGRSLRDTAAESGER
jgi:ABC-2 type transport system ATP-binding protein